MKAHQNNSWMTSKFFLNNNIRCQPQILYFNTKHAINKTALNLNGVYNFMKTFYHKILLFFGIIALAFSTVGISHAKEDREITIALYKAVDSGNISEIKKLLNNGANIEAKKRHGRHSTSPLCLAIENENTKVVKLLLDHGANIEAKSGGGWTPLYAAVIRGKKAEVIKLLLDHGANTEAKAKNGWTPLLNAIRNGNIEIIKLLLDHGANTEAKTNDANTLLHTAVKIEKIEIIKLLLDHGANIEAKVEAKSSKGITPLHTAVKIEKVKVIKLLLDHGANIEAKEKHGWTPLYAAVFSRNAKVVKMLLDHGANTEVKEKHGRTPLYAAGMGGKVKVIKLLLDHGANIEAKEKHGWTPLYAAVFSRNAKVVKMLLDHGANTEAKAKNGMTPRDMVRGLKVSNLFGELQPTFKELQPKKLHVTTPENITKKQKQEAESVFQWCDDDYSVKRVIDCKCLATKFLALRIKSGHLKGKMALVGEITHKECRNVVGATDMEYASCMRGTAFKYYNYRPKDYCECYARKWAELFGSWKGKLDESKKSSLRERAMSYCQRPEAYK